MHISNHLVSIVIPAYNAELFIKETIDSVLNQTYKNFECIVVDDGSKDSTSGIVKELTKSDKRIRLIKQANQGVSAARNAGATNSTGIYIAFLDADDIWVPEHLELLIQELQTHKLEFVQSNYQTIDQNSKKLNYQSNAKGGNIFRHLLLGKYDHYSGISGTMVTRTAFNKTGGFDINLSNVADWDFFLQYARPFQIGLVNKVTWLYRLHSNNMHSGIHLLEKDILYIFKKLSVNYSFPSFVFKLKCYSNMYWMLGGSYIKKNKYKTIKYVALCILCYPPNSIKIAKALIKQTGKNE
ncbi:MAG: glycosyltransferase family 2 protein [Bacteroidetes bacterium]|nr:glycosyltransferase family 2 protein [Bacteroidota bacterium]